MRYTKRLAAPGGTPPDLSPRRAAGTPGVDDRDRAERDTARQLDRLFDLQYRLYAESRRSLLVVLQAMDTAGKDGVIRHVMAGLSPQGCTVSAFKAPCAHELGHDYLWRVHRVAPAKGTIAIFNRSHYEDVLVVRVHGLVPRKEWRRRYDQINAFERHLVENGTTILKLFLHISRKEQLERLQARLDDPRKRWKFSPADLAERRRWPHYMRAYRDAIERCSTPWAPWHVVPSNHKWYRNHAVSHLLVETLEAMRPRIPRPRVGPTGRRLH